MENQTRYSTAARRVAGLGLAAAFLCTGTPVMAATITVNSVADTIVANDGNCTLREAVANANANNANASGADCAAGESGPAVTDVINFAGSATYPVGNGELAITDPVRFNQSGQSPIIDGQGNNRIFNLSANTTIVGLTLRNGLAANANGGALINRATLVLDDVTIANNRATGTGGADQGSGGAIFNTGGGTLQISNSMINDNVADRAGGAIEDNSGNGNAVLLSNVGFSRNNAGVTDVSGLNNIPAAQAAAPGNGGVLHVTGAGNVTITGGFMNNNVAAAEGGALWNDTGEMSVASTSITQNRANGGAADPGGTSANGQGGGGIFNQAGTLLLNSGTEVSNNVAAGPVSSGGGIFSNANTSMNLNTVRIAGNIANRAGGGIEVRDGADVFMFAANLLGNIANTTVVDSSQAAAGGNGGGLHVTGNADVQIQSSLINDNVARVEGGGLWNGLGTMLLVNVSVLNNTASGAGATQGGGGIFSVANGGTINISNSRISGNVADGASGSGGGVLNSVGTIVNISDSEISANTSSRAGGGIENNGTLALDGVTLGGTNSAFGNIAGTNPGNGGGLHNGDTGTATVDNSSVGSNTAVEGGGLWNAGSGNLEVTNTTVSNNQATEDGGGAYQVGGGNATNLRFATVARNRAGADGGGLGTGNAVTGPAFSVRSSIVAQNTADGMDDDFDPASTSAFNTTTSADANALGDLRLFGGVTATHPLQAGSAAIGNAPFDQCTDLAENRDQRGADRPANSSTNCDGGAFELAGNPVITVTNTNNTATAVTPASNNVVLLGLTLENATDSPVTVGGFSGQTNINNADINAANLGALIRGGSVEVFLDSDRDGQLDAGEQALAGGSVDVDFSGAFQVTFGNGAGTEFAANGAPVGYLIVANATTTSASAADRSPWVVPITAGGTLLGLLGLFSVGGMSRRGRWLIAIIAITVGVAACGSNGGGVGDGNGNPDIVDDGNDGNDGNDGDDGNGDDDGNDGDPPPPPPPAAQGGPIQGDVQFVAFTVDQPANGVSTDDFIIGDGMPVRGPAITAASSP